MTVFSDLLTLFGDSGDDALGILMSALAGVAAALAAAIALTVYFRTGYRTGRDVLRHGLATLAAVALLAFVAYDVHHAALAYLGLNPSKPAVEFEIRVPSEALTAVSIELDTDRAGRLCDPRAVKWNLPSSFRRVSAGIMMACPSSA